MIFATITVITLLEITRRTTGLALPILATILILYAFFGNYMPAGLWHGGYSFERIGSYLLSTNGIYTIPLGISATYVFVFILFGTFLESSGSGTFFMNLSKSIAGKYRGGPAKMAIFASATMGTVNGSAVANVASTGAFTIPLMKRVGYRSKFAAATEAVASTGGQILPPIMGAGAFIMADITGIPYSNIVVAAIIPAILYFLAIFLMVDFEAARLNLAGIPKEERPKLSKVMKEQGLLILPLLLIIYLLMIEGYSPIFSALMGTALIIVISWLTKHKIFILKFFRAVADTMVKLIPIAATCATAGLIIGVFSLTGLGSSISRLVINLSGENLFLLLILVMIVTIILGMGLPTVAAYTLAASTVAPALVQMDVPVLSAHLFVFYFACLSTITPPVALSAFAGAAIAGANPMSVGWTALRLGVAAYLIPYMFVLDNNLLLQGDNTIFLFIDILTAIIGIYALAIAAQGYFVDKVNIISRILYALSALSLIIPIFLISTFGIILFTIMILKDLLWEKNTNKMSQDTNGN